MIPQYYEIVENGVEYGIVHSSEDLIIIEGYSLCVDGKGNLFVLNNNWNEVRVDTDGRIISFWKS